MRIISQDGSVDLPYELIGIHKRQRNGKWAVFAFGINGNEDCVWDMAEYETPESANYALEQMLLARLEYDDDTFQFPRDGEQLQEVAQRITEYKRARGIMDAMFKIYGFAEEAVEHIDRYCEKNGLDPYEDLDSELMMARNVSKFVMDIADEERGKGVCKKDEGGS